MPNPGLDNLTPEPRYGSLISSGDVALQADIAALEAADVSLDARLDAVEAPPRCRVRHNANQTVGAGATLALAFNTEAFDTDGMHSTSVDTSHLTCVTAGMYTIKAHLSVTMGAGAGIVQVAARLNGTTDLHIPFATVTGGASASFLVSTDYQLAASDYVEITVFNGSANTITINSAGAYTPVFMMWQAGT